VVTTRTGSKRSGWNGGTISSLLLGKDIDNEPWTWVPVSDVQGKGDEVTIFLSRRFLIKALSYGLNSIGLINEMSPLRFHAQGKQMIVMPLRVDAGSSGPPPPPKPVILSAPRLQVPLPTHKPMINTPAPDASPPSTDGQKTPAEEAIDMTLVLRDKLNEGFNLLRDLSLKLKGINREQKANAREMHSVRSTLRSIQGLKI